MRWPVFEVASIGPQPSASTKYWPPQRNAENTGQYCLYAWAYFPNWYTICVVSELGAVGVPLPDLRDIRLVNTRLVPITQEVCKFYCILLEVENYYA